ncbi:Caskin-1 (CASK-interacting protein 1) [Durusdinium trenchii]|uniref:Caskin-1 (CASK-interacting protein 1) n=3 Tax=Durusdinium trenchii TaxID=1381693 RepID=A0ABP0LM32_9DINO
MSQCLVSVLQNSEEIYTCNLPICHQSRRERLALEEEVRIRDLPDLTELTLPRKPKKIKESSTEPHLKQLPWLGAELSATPTELPMLVHWADGRSYRGGWHPNGWPEGHGELQVPGPEGGHWRGNWDGQLHGEGEFMSNSGARYVGQWFEGQKHGQGTETWPNGMSFRDRSSIEQIAQLLGSAACTGHEAERKWFMRPQVFRLVRLGHFEEALPKLRKEPSLWQTREEAPSPISHIDGVHRKWRDEFWKEEQPCVSFMQTSIVWLTLRDWDDLWKKSGMPMPDRRIQFASAVGVCDRTGTPYSNDGSPSVWERFFTTSRPKGDWTGPDYGSNPCGLPRRSRPSDAEQLRGSESVRRALSESPAPLSCRESALESARRRSKTPLAGYGERSPPCSARGEPIEAGDLPRRRLSDLATAMQSGSGVREALSPPAPVRRLFSRGAPTRRSRTADPVLFDTVLSGYGERSVAPRRQLQVHDEGVQIRDQGRASGGIPWRRLPIYDHNGSLVKTGVAGSSFETENPLRSVTPYSVRLRSGDHIKELISPEKPSDRSSALTPATPSPAARESTPSAGGRLTGRAMQVALVRAQRCNDQQLETERSRCLAKFERLCTPTRSAAPDEAAWGRDKREAHETFRPRRRVAAQHTQPFATDDTTPPAAPARRVVPPQALPSALFLSDGPEPLRFSERHLAARRTWQLEMEMAKIAFTAGRVAASMMSTSDAATPRARSTGALTPTVTPGKAHTLPTRTASRPARATGQAEPAASSIMIQPPTIVVTPVEEPTVSTIAPKTPPRVLEEKTSPQYTPPAAAPAPPAEQVIEMIDHVMSKELPVFSKVLPEPDLVERAPKAAPEPEPELSASPSAAPYPRLLSSAKERSTSTPTKQTQAKPVRQAKQGLAKVDVRASNLQTPLMWAMTRGHLQVGKVLLQASADPFAQDSVGASPLILAVQHAHVGVAWRSGVGCANLLIEKRLEAAMLLLIALVAPNEPGATHGPSTLQRLLQVRDMRGCTAVHWAAYKGDMPALQPGELSEEQHWRLLDYFDADFTALDDEKMTALHRAAQGQQEEVIGLLLDRGVDPSVLDVHGRSCLDARPADAPHASILDGTDGVAEQVAKTGRMARRLRRLLESKPSKDFEGCESETLKVLLEDVVLICKTEVVPAPEQPDKQTDTVTLAEHELGLHTPLRYVLEDASINSEIAAEVKQHLESLQELAAGTNAIRGAAATPSEGNFLCRSANTFCERFALASLIPASQHCGQAVTASHPSFEFPEIAQGAVASIGVGYSWDLECKDQAVIADMGGSNLNMKLDSFPTITARKTAHIGSQRYTDGQMFKNSLGAKARLSDFNSCPKTLLDVTDVDDKLFADMQQTRLPASALGHATGNAMSISVVERIVMGKILVRRSGAEEPTGREAEHFAKRVWKPGFDEDKRAKRMAPAIFWLCCAASHLTSGAHLAYMKTHEGHLKTIRIYTTTVHCVNMILRKFKKAYEKNGVPPIKVQGIGAVLLRNADSAASAPPAAMEMHLEESEEDEDLRLEPATGESKAKKRRTSGGAPRVKKSREELLEEEAEKVSATYTELLATISDGSQAMLSASFVGKLQRTQNSKLAEAKSQGYFNWVNQLQQLGTNFSLVKEALSTTVSIACFEPLDARMRRRYLTELQSSAWTLTPNLAVAFELGVPLCLLLFLLAAQKDPGKVPARVKGNSAVEDRRSMFFPWCCKPWSAEKAHVDQNTEYVRALPLSSSSSTSFPKAYNFAQDEPPDDLQQAAPSRTLEPVRCMGPTFTPENQEKALLRSEESGAEVAPKLVSKLPRLAHELTPGARASASAVALIATPLDGGMAVDRPLKFRLSACGLAIYNGIKTFFTLSTVDQLSHQPPVRSVLLGACRPSMRPPMPTELPRLVASSPLA